MERRKRKNKFPVSLICRRGFICLSLICALIIQPYTILADDSFAQADSADTAAQNNTADSAHSADVAAQDKAADSAAQDNAADPVHDAAQDNAADSAEASANIEDNRKEEAGDSDGVPSDSMKSIEDGEDRDNVPEAGSSDVNADAISNVDANVEANVEANAKAEADANAKANSDANTEAEADASSVTARSICQRENDHVLEETVDTTMTSSASCDKAGKTTWTALFENGIFTKQTRSVDTEPTCDETEEETVDRQSKSDDSGIRTNTVKTASAATARKTSDRKTSGSAATHQTSVHTADDSDLAHWFMLFAGALACMAALFVLHFNRRRV